MNVVRDTLLALALVLFCSAGPAMAMGSDKSESASDPDFAAGVQAVSDGEWALAVMKLNAVVAGDAANADAHNYLGYAHRKMGELDKAFEHYGQALTLDPEHRGAHEYIGEAYLMAGNLAKAEEHLKRLDELCTFGCDEYYALKEAVAAYRAKNGG